MTSKTPSKVRTRKYKTADGDYLVVTHAGNENRIAWFIAEWDDVGGCIGEGSGRLAKNPPKEKSEWEIWQVERTVAPLVDGKDRQGFYFESEAKAKLVLAAVNEALFTGDAPWPVWAVQAKAAGWTPPKGWKP